MVKLKCQYSAYSLYSPHTWNGCGHSKNKTHYPISSNSHPSATTNIAIHCFKREVIQQQREHHIIKTKYEAVHRTYVSEYNSSSGMLIILTESDCLKSASNHYIIEVSVVSLCCCFACNAKGKRYDTVVWRTPLNFRKYIGKITRRC